MNQMNSPQPFNEQQYNAAPNVWRVTANDKPVRVLCTDAELEDGYTIVGIHDSVVQTWQPGGRYTTVESDPIAARWNLVMEHITVEFGDETKASTQHSLTN